MDFPGTPWPAQKECTLALCWACFILSPGEGGTEHGWGRGVFCQPCLTESGLRSREAESPAWDSQLVSEKDENWAGNFSASLFPGRALAHSWLQAAAPDSQSLCHSPFAYFSYFRPPPQSRLPQRRLLAVKVLQRSAPSWGANIACFPGSHQDRGAKDRLDNRPVPLMVSVALQGLEVQ